MTWILERPTSDIITSVTDASPFAFWRFDDDLTDTASDGPYDLTLTAGTETYIDTDNQRTAFDFDGSTYMVATGYKGVTGTDPRAISAWIKLTESADSPQIVGWGANATGEKWLFVVGTTGAIRVAVTGGNIVGSTDVTDGKWHHVVATLESGDTNVTDVKLFVDGEEETIASSSAREISTDAANDVAVGAFLDSLQSDSFFNGQMDEVAIFDALTDSEILAIYNGGRSYGDLGSAWKESTEEWVSTDMPRSGARYKTQLVTVSDQGKIYYGSA